MRLTAAIARTRHRDTRGGPLRRCLHIDGKAQHGAARPGQRTVFTADQLHTQRQHVRYLHRRHGCYVFTVGGNQPKLFAALDALPWHLIAVEHATIDRGHARIEVRIIRTLPATPTITGLFPHTAQVFLLERCIYDTAGKPLAAVAVLGIANSAATAVTPTAVHWSC